MATILKAGNTILRTAGSVFVTGKIPQPEILITANSITGANGSAVAVAPDTSGKGNHLYQTVAIEQPTLLLNARGVNSALRFDGVNDWAQPLVAIAAARTVLIAFRCVDPFNNGESGFISSPDFYFDSRGGVFLFKSNAGASFSDAQFKNRAWVNGGQASPASILRATVFSLVSMDLTEPTNRTITKIAKREFPGVTFGMELLHLEIYSVRLTDVDRIARETFIKNQYGL